MCYNCSQDLTKAAACEQARLGKGDTTDIVVSVVWRGLVWSVIDSMQMFK